MLDNNLSMDKQILSIRKKSYAQIRRISSIRQFLTEDATKKLISACVLSQLDYCNALLADYPKTSLNALQLVQNDAARLVFRARRTQHVSPLLQQLHWLPIEKRVKYKICCILYNIYNQTAPSYLCDRVRIYKPNRELRSATEPKFDKAPKFNREGHGGHSVPVLADRHWNNLPLAIRQSPSISSFKQKLKTYLFDQAFW